MPQSALIVPVPEAEPTVARWRARFDPSARLGVPAHVTLLFPFVAPQRLSSAILQAIGDLCASADVFDFALRAVGQFPGVLYLAPEPTAPFIALTERLVGRFPQCPPYGGRHRDIRPHLTVAQAGDAELLQVRTALMAALDGRPIAATCTRISLIENASGPWRPVRDFALRGSAAFRPPAAS